MVFFFEVGETGKKYKNVTEEILIREITEFKNCKVDSGDSFLTLGLAKVNTFIQTCPSTNPYFLEYCDNGKMYSVFSVEFDFISDWFLRFLRDDASWVEAVNWIVDDSDDYNATINIFDKKAYSEKIKSVRHRSLVVNFTPASGVGEVYLLKSGPFYKIGKSIDGDRRISEISLQLPYPVELVHKIQTDDISGIEVYWHKRFSEKRANGEWFLLTDSEVAVFKSRRAM